MDNVRIIKKRENKEQTKHAHKRTWSKEDITTLKQLYYAHYSIYIIAKTLNRSVDSISSKITKLNNKNLQDSMARE